MNQIRKELFQQGKVKFFIGTIIFPFLFRFCMTCLIFFYAYIISTLTKNNWVQALEQSILFISIFSVIYFFYNYYSIILEIEYTNYLKKKVIRNYIFKPEDSQNSYNNGQLTEIFKVTSTVSKVPKLTFDYCFILIELIAIVIGIYYFLGIYVALVNILLIGVYFLFQRTGNILAKEKKNVLLEESDINEFFEDSIENIEIMKSYQKETVFDKKIKNHGYNLLKVRKKYSVIEVTIQLISRYFNIAIASISVLATLTLATSNKELFIVSSSFFSVFLSQCLMELFENSRERKNIKEILLQYTIFSERIKEPSLKDVKKSDTNSLIEIKELSYDYPGRTIFDSISFTFPRIGLIAIQGESGSGKSTFLKCLSGLNQDFKGNILINGVTSTKDINEMISISYVNQSSMILEMSISDNIYLGSLHNVLDTNDKEISQLISLLPPIDNEASTENLSGGQKQIIEILRGIVKQPDLFILDEPTSSQHGDSGELIISLLSNYAKKSLVVVATHDSNLLDKADIIIDIEDGNFTKRRVR